MPVIYGGKWLLEFSYDTQTWLSQNQAQRGTSCISYTGCSFSQRHTPILTHIKAYIYTYTERYNYTHIHTHISPDTLPYTFSWPDLGFMVTPNYKVSLYVRKVGRELRMAWEVVLHGVCLADCSEDKWSKVHEILTHKHSVAAATTNSQTSKVCKAIKFLPCQCESSSFQQRLESLTRSLQSTAFDIQLK